MQKDNTPIGKKLQKKAEKKKDEMLRTLLIQADIKGLSKEEQEAQLKRICNEILNK